MNQRWSTFTPAQKVALIRNIDPGDVKTLYDLTDDEIDAVVSSAEAIAAEDATTAPTAAYEDFLRTEYSTLATAHFQTATNITSFFQFYIIIVGIPLTAAGLFTKVAGTASTQSTASTQVKSTALDDLLSNYGLFVGVVFLAIAVVGFCMMAYIVNLRLDALQYARAINGVRRYFVERMGLSVVDQIGSRALPRTIHRPLYREWRFFGWVVLAFAILNTVYLVSAHYSLIRYFGAPLNWVFWVVFAVLVIDSPLIHAITYLRLASYREDHIQRTHIIGIDIDGVLNEHRSHFCQILHDTEQRDFDPQQITRIPLHECEAFRNAMSPPNTPPEQRIVDARDFEQVVFHQTAYWTQMGPREGAARVIKQLQDALHFKVMIFSYRPWPNWIEYEKAMNRRGAALHWTAQEREQRIRQIHAQWKRIGWLGTFRPRTLKRLTKKWLQEHDITPDKLIIERGDTNVADPQTKSRNRFMISRKKEIRIFVEDDPFKARKLADICEVVYLMDHPYNRPENLPKGYLLPGNVKRVSSWEDIKVHMREQL